MRQNSVNRVHKSGAEGLKRPIPLAVPVGVGDEEALHGPYLPPEVPDFKR